jgi:hypothetical protein
VEKHIRTESAKGNGLAARCGGYDPRESAKCDPRHEPHFTPVDWDPHYVRRQRGDLTDFVYDPGHSLLGQTD